jgi:transposase-like protein/5-methylcytosine-specific restriction endonuclease McrA
MSVAKIRQNPNDLSDQKFQQLVKDSFSVLHIAVQLGYIYVPLSLSKRLGLLSPIDTGHLANYTPPFKKVPLQELSDILVKATSWKGLLLELGYKQTAGDKNKTLRKYFDKHKLDYSHLPDCRDFQTLQRISSQNADAGRFKQVPIENILTINSTGKSTDLKRRLIKEKLLTNSCKVCLQTDPQVLILDHINGDHFDNQFSNLQILCANCHLKTPTYGRQMGYFTENQRKDYELKKSLGLLKTKKAKKGPLEEIFAINTQHDGRTLKLRLIEEKIYKEICAVCGKDEKAVLILDHVNGNRTDNRIENLRILCANCHMKTPTFGIKNTAYLTEIQKTERIKAAENRYLESLKRATNRRKVPIRPPLDTLLKEVQERSYRSVGEKYGVTDNAVRRWIREYNATPPKKYKAKAVTDLNKKDEIQTNNPLLKELDNIQQELEDILSDQNHTIETSSALLKSYCRIKFRVCSKLISNIKECFQVLY